MSEQPFDPSRIRELHAHEAARPASPKLASVDERAARVPVQLVPMRVASPFGVPPVVDRLALVGEPVVEVLGTPLLAVSDVDTAGVSVIRGGAVAKRTPTGLEPLELAGLLVTGLAGAFVGFLASGLAVEGSPSQSLWMTLGGLVGGALAAGMLWSSRRPVRTGWTCVVGPAGAQFGTVAGATLGRTVVNYVDPDDVWFEQTALGVTTRNATLDVTRRLAIRARADLSLLLEAGGAVDVEWAARGAFSEGAPRLSEERYVALSEIWARVCEARLALADSENVFGVEHRMPTLDGRTVVLVPSRAEGPQRFRVEVRRGDTTLLTGDVRVSLDQGVYVLSAGGRSERILRSELGNPFLLDAYVLGMRGPAVSRSACLPRKDLVPDLGRDRRRPSR